MSSKKQSLVKEKGNKKEKKQKVGMIARLKCFFSGVKQEVKRVHWTGKKDILKYSVSTFIFVVFFSLFFYVIDVLFALVHSIIG